MLILLQSLSDPHFILLLSPFHPILFSLPSLLDPHPFPIWSPSHPFPASIPFGSSFHPGPIPIPSHPGPALDPHPILVLLPSLLGQHFILVPIPSCSCIHPVPIQSPSHSVLVPFASFQVPILAIFLSFWDPHSIRIPFPSLSAPHFIPILSPSHPPPVSFSPQRSPHTTLSWSSSHPFWVLISSWLPWIPIPCWAHPDPIGLTTPHPTTTIPTSSGTFCSNFCTPSLGLTFGVQHCTALHGSAGFVWQCSITALHGGRATVVQRCIGVQCCMAV